MCNYKILVLFGIVTISFYKCTPVKCDQTQNVTRVINYNRTNVNDSAMFQQLIEEVKYLLRRTEIQLEDTLVGR